MPRMSTIAANAEVSVVTPTLETAQTGHKSSNPRFYQQLTPQSTAVSGMTYTVERYTHGNEGEGWIVNYTYRDGETVEIKRVNKGPAKYLEQDWLKAQ